MVSLYTDMHSTAGAVERVKNPVKRGYIDEAEHWRYSSARDYQGIDGLLEVERLW
jgi:hypothetical protein